MIAHDKGKPVASQGRKAVSLPLSCLQRRVRLSGCRRRSKNGRPDGAFALARVLTKNTACVLVSLPCAAYSRNVQSG